MERAWGQQAVGSRGAHRSASHPGPVLVEAPELRFLDNHICEAAPLL